MNNTLVVDGIGRNDHGGGISRHDVGSGIVGHEGEGRSSGRSVVLGSDSIRVGYSTVDDVVGEDGLNGSLVQGLDGAGNSGDGSIVRGEDGQTWGVFEGGKEIGHLDDTSEGRGEFGCDGAEVRGKSQNLVDDVDLEVGRGDRAHGSDVGRLDNLHHLGVGRVSGQDERGGSVSG